MAIDREIIQQENLNQNDENSEEHKLLVTNVRSLKKPSNPMPKGKELPMREAKNNAFNDTAFQQSDGSTSESDKSKTMPIKLGPKRFGCPFCSTEMSVITNMRSHILTHTGEKPFTCNDCWKSYAQKVNLEQHVSTHTGERPFKCKDCGKSFNWKKCLIRHELIHNRD